MSFLESLLKGLNNANITQNLDAFRLKETIRRTIVTSQVVQNADIKKKSENSEKREEFASITGAAGYGALEIREGMSMEEIVATKRCINYSEMLKNGGLSKEKEEEIQNAFIKAKKDLERIREKYNSAGQYFNDTVNKANQIIKSIKTPKYISDEKKRSSKYKSMYYGVEDPFYDKMKEIYGEEGLKGYRNERLEDFKNISDEDVELASMRYKKVNNALTTVKTIAQLGIWIASMIFVYPKSGQNPIIFGAGAAIFTELIKLPEMYRSSKNYEIFFARRKIGEDLGLLDKSLTLGDVEKTEHDK